MNAKNVKIVLVLIPVLVLLIGSIFLFSAYSSMHLSTEATTNTASQVPATNSEAQYILVGGENGSWFKPGQYPRLSQVSLSNHSARNLSPVPGIGSVWSGAFNGSDWLVSGFGSNGGDNAPNPFLYVFNGNAGLNDTVEDASEAEWSGGDIFAASSNGSTWFVSGMGSGVLAPSNKTSNHFSTGLFNGTTFVDLTSKLPEQKDGILYANAFNGTEWLVGGGWEYGPGVLFAFNGTSFTDLTGQIMRAVYQFGSVQSIAWNGKYWLIGGIGFLAMYDGSKFTDLTSALTQNVIGSFAGLEAVNSIAWNGSSWLLGGGLPIAVDDGYSIAWMASYDSQSFANLTGLVPTYARTPHFGSSILSITSGHGSWYIGGYADNQSLLLAYDSEVSDLSSLVSDMSYVNWVGASP